MGHQCHYGQQLKWDNSYDMAAKWDINCDMIAAKWDNSCDMTIASMDNNKHGATWKAWTTWIVVVSMVLQAHETCCMTTWFNNGTWDSGVA